MKQLSTLLALVFGFTLSAQTTNISFTHGGCNIQGVIDMPPGNGPHPAIVLVSGSGQNDRDTRIHLAPNQNINCLYPGLVGDTVYPLRDLGQLLSDSGYAVLRYDDITISCPNYAGPFSFENVFLIGMSALDYLKTRSDIDTNQLILAGHSEGAMIVSVMANRRNDVKAIISVAGNRTPLDSILKTQLIDIADSCGGDSAAAALQGQQVIDYFNQVRQQNYTGLPPFAGLSPQEWNTYINAADSVAILYDQAQLPALFLGFEKDFNVPSSELFRFQQETTGGHDFYLIPELNHYLTPPNHPRVPRSLGDTIVYWLRDALLSNPTFTQTEVNAASIYPNPHQSDLHVKSDKPFTLLQLTNMAGVVVYRQTFDKANQCHIESAAHPSGVYLLSIRYTDGSEERIRVVKQ